MFRFLAPALLLSAAAPAFAQGAPAQAPAAAPAMPADPGTPAASFSSERIGVTIMGEGPDVVLIPGLSSTPNVWRTTMAALPGYRYHLIHVSGFAGRPAGANAEGSYLVPVADEIARYIREAHLDHPELVGKAMVVDMLPYIGILVRRPGMTDAQMNEMVGQIRGFLANASPDQRRMMTSMSISGMVRTESARQAQLDASLASDQAVSAQGFVDLLTISLLDDVPRINAPLVVLYTQPAQNPQGPQFTPEQIDNAYRLSYRSAPQAVVTRVPDSAHFIMIDNAPFFQAKLREFLTTPGTPRPAAGPPAAAPAQ
jgi:pimeloyl-ACP methyl ester carboxylesterase